MKQKLFWAMLPFMALSFVSCEDEEPDVGFDQTSQAQEFQTGEIRLGEKINSPVTLRNMQRAADSLAQRNGMVLRSAMQLEATHLYVRFLPQDSAEYELLVSDTLLDPTPYPWDYELTEGDSYHDPSLPWDAYQWQYTVVPAEHDLEQYNVRYEVLEELYMPNEMFDKVSAATTRSVNEETTYLKELLDESVRQNAPDQMEPTETLRKWTPTATIKAYDDILDAYIPLDGVKVRITTFAFVKKTAITNIYGQVSFDKRNRDVSYSIEWERDNWDIRDGGTQAYYNGPNNTKSAWNLNIGKGTPKSLHISAIHRALLKYYYGSIDGLIRPSKALKVSYQEGADPDGSAHGSTYYERVEYLFNIKPEIVIYGKYLNYKDELTECLVSKVLSVTFHEISHASHAMFVGADKFKATFIGIRESWASAVQWYLTRHLYAGLPNGDKKYHTIDFLYKKQIWESTDKDKYYTPLFIDLYDDLNQFEEEYFYPQDDVCCYPLSFFNINISSLTTIYNLRDFLKKNKISGVTDSQIDNLLNSYITIWTN